MEIFPALITAYLIVTLSATSLAKFRNRRIAVVGILRERVVPYHAATAVIIMVAFTELLLATALMLQVKPEVTGFAAASLFFTFCAYRLVVALRTKSLICVCAGTSRTDPASLAAVVGTVVACLLQAALACTLAVLDEHPAGIPFRALFIVAWLAPFGACLIGSLRLFGRSATDRFPAEPLLSPLR
ncbi:MAG: MauE/DoxX family redox-associated membrane protein [Streptosporangiaceae bacterium]